MKWFVKDILADAAKLSALIILPMAFLGPGWRPKDNDYPPLQKVRKNGDSDQPSSAEAAAEGGGGDRYIEILRAFDAPGGHRDDRRDREDGDD